LWTMGLLKPEDWAAKWIMADMAAPVSTDPKAAPENPPAPWIRKTFTLATEPTRAITYVNVMGYYELYVNGQKVGTDVLSPAVSRYDKRSYYLTYDVTSYLRSGVNCIGLWTSRGWYWPGKPGVKHPNPIARVQLEIETGGQRNIIATDGSWMTRPSNRSILGQWTFNAFGGECVDARNDDPEWCLPSEADKGWSPVSLVTAPPPTVKVAAQMCRPNRVCKGIPCFASKDLGKGLYELDFGRVLTGWLQLQLHGLSAGQQVKMYFADRRYETPAGDNTPIGFVKSSYSARTFATANGPVAYEWFGQQSKFISAGHANEIFQHKFNTSGFRYVIVEGLSSAPRLDDAVALPVEGDLEEAGTFDCSNDLLNRIYRLTLQSNRSWSMGGYFAENIRERLGYGPIEVMQEPTIMTMDVPALFTKWMVNWLDDQRGDGSLPTVSPAVSGAAGGPAWGGTLGSLPWAMYLYYGDRRVIEQYYQPARRYLGYLQRGTKDDLLFQGREPKVFLGDWCPPDHGADAVSADGVRQDAWAWPGAKANEVFNNCYRLYLWQLLERSARILGKIQDADYCATRIAELSQLIHKTYYDPEKHTYVLDSQIYKCLPLYTGVVPETERAAVQKALEDVIVVKRQGHLDTGSLGTWFLIQWLQKINRNDLMFTMVNQKTYPGWGYMVEQGATSLWEQWNGYKGQSVNCYPAIGHWFQQALSGIRPDESGPGFKKIIIRPAIVGDLHWVKGSYDSIHGRIVSNWKREGDELTMEITIPPNTAATVFVPVKDPSTITESGKAIDKADGVKFLRMENDVAVYAVGSGQYYFKAQNPLNPKGITK